MVRAMCVLRFSYLPVFVFVFVLFSRFLFYQLVYFDDASQWRQEMGIERMHLVAHSLSAFFAVRYAEQHPERLESLV